MTGFEMAYLAYGKNTLMLHIVAIAVGVFSLALPWWTLIALFNSEIVATYNLFLWGAAETGFLWTHPLPFEWFSYTTFALVAIGVILGLLGYRFLATGTKNGKLLIALEGVCTISACLFYAFSLLFTFSDPGLLYHPVNSYWTVAPSETHGGVSIALLDVFGVRSAYAFAVLQFLSIGFFLAILASVLSSIVFLRLRKNGSQ